ncbi:4Fe-4S dicluster domain-containing protein [candidate division KSB3 bacterium]|uniref:4Fe-4S dicluster domain-containing protein n=1 Tax=candidate division KSB3 bacterium TaxID=2044937 RepID=A0A9D5JTT0_9BACT|nr:4Fe-4S dicluster domain-containing protein [candidate division KSB3 bacterium]MBD3324083.1 4Fe-4S dicluster domain-containing protein [candidate division KSB3 bacterium]
MLKKTFVLSFPQAVVQQPVTYHLVKDYNWIVNILRARVSPNQSSSEEGMLVVEVQGVQEDVDGGLDYLARIGVHYEPLAQDVVWDEDRCTHCTACTSLCPTGALYVIRPEMRVAFDKEKCIACELCLKVCSYQAVTISI